MIFMCRHGITFQLQMLNKLLYIYTKKNHIIYLDQKSSGKKTLSLTTLLVISACESLDAFAMTSQHYVTKYGPRQGQTGTDNLNNII